jgi:hypothetical protein
LPLHISATTTITTTSTVVVVVVGAVAVATGGSSSRSLFWRGGKELINYLSIDSSNVKIL